MTSRDNDFLEVADRIGMQLARDALWHGGHCNWTGDSMEFLEGRWQVAHRSLGADLYAGSSGVALFLGRLSATGGERVYARIAAAAAEHALAHALELPPGSRSGHYAGALGVAWAGVQVATVIDESALLDRCSGLLSALLGQTLDAEGLDVIAGSAGAIGTLLDLAEHFSHDPALAAKLRSEALQHGDRLVATAKHDEYGMSWPAPGQSRGLCGLSHGAAGFAWALLALHRDTGDPRFRVASEEALRYERAWFDPHAQNWPDLRDDDNDRAFEVIGTRPEARRPLGFMSAWCHGAPGIGLARLAVSKLGADETCREEAAAAIRSTSASTQLMLGSGQANFSLCHGLAGNAEILLEAVRGGLDPTAMSLVHQVAEAGSVRYARSGAPWPCGILGGGETPSLLLGLAGIGHFYLRLHDPKVPTVLIGAA